MKTVSLDEARRMAGAVKGELAMAEPPAPPAPAAPAAPPPDRMADAITELARALVLVVTPRAATAPPPVAAAQPIQSLPETTPEPAPEPVEPPPSMSLAQRAVSKAPKPRQKHSYELATQRTGGELTSITVARDGKARYRFDLQPDGSMLVERDGRLCYEVSPRSDEAGLITRLSVTPIGPDGPAYQ